jgi:hypothetical protein
MKGETYIYAANALAGADDGGVYKASQFTSAEIHGAAIVELNFKAGNNAAKNSVVRLTTPANLGTESKLVFKTICKQKYVYFSRSTRRNLYGTIYRSCSNR